MKITCLLLDVRKPNKKRIMENQEQTSFTFEIDNFREKKDMISSPIFLCGGCQWSVDVYFKGLFVEESDRLSLFLCITNPESLRLGYRRRATCSIILLNPSGKELYRMHECCDLFHTQISNSYMSRNLYFKKV